MLKVACSVEYVLVSTLLSKFEYVTSPSGRGYKTVLSTPCSNQASLSHRAHTQRRSPNFLLSTVSYSDLSTKRPNPESAQERAQRRTQKNKDGSSRRNRSILLSKFVVLDKMCSPISASESLTRCCRSI